MNDSADFGLVLNLFAAEEVERLRPGADELGSLRAPLQHPEAHAEDSVLAAQGRGQEDHSSGP